MPSASSAQCPAVTNAVGEIRNPEQRSNIGLPSLGWKTTSPTAPYWPPANWPPTIASAGAQVTITAPTRAAVDISIRRAIARSFRVTGVDVAHNGRLGRLMRDKGPLN